MLLFLSLLIFVAPAFSSLGWDQTNCHSGSDFSVELLDGNTAQVYGAEINLLFSRSKVRIYTYPSTDAVKIVVKNAFIIFEGNSSTNLDTPPRRIHQIVYLQAKGHGRLKKYCHKTKLTECQIYLMRNGTVILGIPREVENKFRQIANNCIGYKICSKIGTVQPEDYVSKRPYEKKSFSEVAILNAGNNETKKSLELQSYINSIVDFVLAEVIYHLKENHEERIKIPDVSQEFSFGTGILETTGRFDATDGHFSDLTTLGRATDAALERQGFKFSIACGFGLSSARIEYDDYKLKFGIIKIGGMISVNIDGIFIDMKFSVDYNQNPCKAKLEYLKNTQLGRLDVQVTGMAPLNFLASYLATLIATQWEGDITSLIETKVSKVINDQMNNFNCEKFRPFT